MQHSKETLPQNTKPHKKRFHAGWIVAILIPLIIVSAALYAFSKYLYGVEYYSPTVDLEKYVALVEAKDYAGIMAYVGLETSPFNSVKEYQTYFESYYGDKVESSVYTERKLRRTEESRFYDVQINKKPAQTFKLTRTGEKRLYIFDTWKVELDEVIPTRSVIIRTSPGVTITLNGTVVTEEYRLPEADFSLDYYKNVKDDNKELQEETYRIDGLIAISSLSVVTGTGEACEVTLLEGEKSADAGTDENVDIYLVKHPIPADQIEGLKSITETITKKYAEFVAKDVSFSALVPYLYKNTKLYDDLDEFYNGWFTGHQSYGFENVKFFDMQYFDDNHCVVGIEFNYFVYKSNQRYDYTVNYHVYLLKSGEKWLMADMSIE